MLLADMSMTVVAKVALSVAVLGGVLMCFFGLRLFKVALGTGGFVVGALIAAYCAWRYPATPAVMRDVKSYLDILGAMLRSPERTTYIVWACAGGVAGAIVSVLLDKVGMFVLGVCLGGMLANVLMAQMTPSTYLMGLAILGLFGGIVALAMRRPIVIVSTALNGALALMFGIYALLKNQSPGQAVNSLSLFRNDTYVFLACALVLGAVGVYVQFSTAPKEKGAGKKDASKEKKE